MLELNCFVIYQLTHSRSVESRSVFENGVCLYSLIAIHFVDVPSYACYFFVEMRPAELYFQMHLLARQLNVGPNATCSMESSQSPQSWVIRAIHMNPSCMRYWRILHSLTE